MSFLGGVKCPYHPAAYPSVLRKKGEAIASVSHNPSRPGGPQYSKIVKQKVNGVRRTEKFGTCSLDGLWAHLKLRLRSFKAKTTALKRAKVHFQWLHWTRPEDRWPLIGHILKVAGS